MRLLLLALFLSVAVFCHVKALSPENELFVETLWDILTNEGEDSEEDVQLERRDKSYLTAQKHPEKLRECVKCVGKERNKGKNVKQATNHCNKVCKRQIFDTRSFNDDLE